MYTYHIVNIKRAIEAGYLNGDTEFTYHIVNIKLINAFNEGVPISVYLHIT